MIRHHPAETTLFACAAGTLPAAHAEVIRVHAALCPACAAGLALAEAAGGVLLEALAPTAMAEDALARTLARLDHVVPAPAPAPARFDVAALASGRWRRVAPGIAMMPLLRRDATDSRLDLIRVAPGRALLSHGHSGAETTCVLAGTFSDETGDYGFGDCMETDTALAHQPRARGEEECICLIAVTHHLQPKSWLGRLVRPLLGM
jgi:putative transcriptional regulator